LAGTHRVEWIVEAASEYLPVFETVNFDTCVAGTPHEIFSPGRVARLTISKATIRTWMAEQLITHRAGSLSQATF
jgi:hypothetical protein